MVTMGKSELVQKFFADLNQTDAVKYEIVAKLYTLFQETDESFTDKIIYGGIGIYIGDEFSGGIWVYSNHVSLVLGDGYKLKDPHGVLEGGGKFRRHIKLHEMKDLENKKCSEYVKQWFELYK